MVLGRNDTPPPATRVIRFLSYLWNKWNIQAAVLASLAFQIILIFSARSRKRTNDPLKIFVIWTMYLLADYVATFAIGLINNDARPTSITAADITAVGEITASQESLCPARHPKYIAAFWAPFLLLHLGGPDTITAFSIEDNELWNRHLLTLIVQVIAVLLVFYRYQILADDNPFLIPTLLISVAGFIKYIERTYSLNLASLTNMKKSMRQKPDPGPDYAELMEELSSKQAANLSVKIEVGGGYQKASKGETEEYLKKLTDMEVVEHGFKFYKIFRGLVVDHTFGFDERNDSHSFFSRLKDCEDAFRVMEVELNFMYDAMFTKMITIQGKILGYTFRIANILLIVAATVFFALFIPKNTIHPLDLKVTHCLLAGAVILDSIALMELFLSDWTVALILSKEEWIKRCKRLKQCVEGINKVCKWISSNKRWSGEIYQYSLINHSLHKQWKWVESIMDCFGLKEKVDSCLYSTTQPVTDELKELIFYEIKKKGKQATQTTAANEMFLSKGEWTLLDYSCGPSIMATVGQDVEFDQSVLSWHIATEICYFTLEKDDDDDDDDDDDREICRYISEYLVYLLVMEKKLTSTLAGILETRFRDTCEEGSNFFAKEFSNLKQHNDQSKGICSKAKEMCCNVKECIPICLKTMWNSIRDDILYIAKLKCFFNKSNTTRKMTEWERLKKEKEDKKRKFACELLRKVDPQVKPSAVKGDRSKSLLFDACILAKDLQELCSEEIKDDEYPAKKYSKKQVWKMMSRVWVELLSYGACHCRGDAHAQQLAKGGELLTFVWLLMAHFGLGEQFRVQTGQARARIVVG